MRKKHAEQKSAPSKKTLDKWPKFYQRHRSCNCNCNSNSNSYSGVSSNVIPLFTCN